MRILICLLDHDKLIDSRETSVYPGPPGPQKIPIEIGTIIDDRVKQAVAEVLGEPLNKPGLAGPAAQPYHSYGPITPLSKREADRLRENPTHQHQLHQPEEEEDDPTPAV